MDPQLRAARCIKRFYRTTVVPYSTKNLATAFNNLGIDLAYAKSAKFQDLRDKVYSEEVCNVASDMLQRLIKYANWKRGNKPFITGIVSVKIFLASYFVGGHPKQVFDIVIGDLEKDLMKATEPFLICLHKTLSELQSGKPWSQVRRRPDCKNIMSLLCGYLQAFKVLLLCFDFKTT